MSNHGRDRLITLRREMGLNQREAAKVLGISQTNLALFEKGRRSWPDERIAQAIEALEDWCPDVEHTPEEREAYLAQMRAIIDHNNAEGWPGIAVPL